MTRQIKRASIVAGLAVVATLVTSGREARADLAGGLSPDMAGASPGPSITDSITTKGGIVQNGDPSYTYQLEVFLTGTITPGSTTSVTLDNLVGVNWHSLPSISILDEYGTSPGVSWTPYIHVIGHVHEHGHTYTVSDVTWKFSGNSSVTSILNPDDGPSGLLLGVFQVTTAPKYSHSLHSDYPSFLTDHVKSSYYLNGKSGGLPTDLPLQLGGVFVPEPPTAIGPLCAIAALPVVWFMKRRRALSLRAA
jgi:hypothetical protein